eukprot:TRINITY_DN812_c2_g1_i1.p1 TRINITY_DN812_c2_g1~~TRINITY_DN812_c2_g1_i1.p1  ORF type:complete len:1539 (-),score=311.37 TRINITY_DN812_c2_g1_i1:20-4636(-)
MEFDTSSIDAFCSPDIFGPIENGFLSVCFTQIAFNGFCLLFLLVFGIRRLYKVSSIKPERNRRLVIVLPWYSGLRLFEVLIALNIMLILIVEILFYYFKENEDLPTYKLLINLLVSAGWAFSIAIMIVDRRKGLRHDWTITGWWHLQYVTYFLVAYQYATTGFSFYWRFFSAAGIVFVILCQLIANFIYEHIRDKGPNMEDNKTQDEESNDDPNEISLRKSEKSPLLSSSKSDIDIIESDDDDKVKNLKNNATTVSPEDLQTEFGKTTMMWLNPLLDTGYKRTIEDEDLYPLANGDEAEKICSRFEDEWQKEVERNVEPSLWRVLRKIYGFQFLIQGFYKLLNDFGVLIQPVLLRYLLGYMTSVDEPVWHGYLYALAFFGGSFLQSITLQRYFLNLGRIGMRIRAALVGAVYRKAFRQSAQSKQEGTIGEITNLQSIDAGRFLMATQFLHMIWSAPLQMIVSLGILIDTVGVSALAGTALLFFSLPLTAVLGRKMGLLTQETMKLKDSRSKVMNEILQGIRVLKFFSWEESFTKRVTDVRDGEVGVLKKVAIVRSLFFFVFTSTPLFVSVITFAVYSAQGNELTSQVAFTSLALFNLLRAPLILLPMVITSVIELRVSVERLRTFLSKKEIQSYVESNTSKDSKLAIKITNGSFQWEDSKPVLQDVNISIPKGELVAVVGSVGSGKSSILSALLGEVVKTKGQVELNGSVAYVPQQAWIMNETVRNNILFGDVYNEEKYKSVIKACELTKDFQILTAGDETEIGEKGINLSGGQKQRISLARALYSDCDIVLMDDPLSAVDVHVGKSIFTNCIRKSMEGRTRVLVTHNLHMVPQVDRIIVLTAGSVTEVGTYKELISRNGNFAKLIQELENDASKRMENDEENEEEEIQEIVDDDDQVNTSPLKSSSTLLRSSSSLKKSQKSDDKSSTSSSSSGSENQKGKLISNEGRTEGTITFKTYIDYFRECGGVAMGVFVLFMFGLSQGASAASDWWLSKWTDDEQAGLTNSTGPWYYLGIYAGIGSGFAVINFVRMIVLFFTGIYGASVIHNKMLGKVMRSPVSFFDTTPSGRIMNRFTKDLSTVDSEISTAIVQVLSTVLGVITIIVIIGTITPIIFVLLPSLIFLYRFVQHYYLQSSLDLQRIDSTTKSPIFALFSETLNGVSSIRAYSKQDQFISLNDNKVNKNTQAWYLGWAAARWLTLRLEMIANLVILGACVFAIVEKGTVEAGLVGLSITYAMQLTFSLNMLVRMSTTLENNMVAVERCLEYQNLDTEAPPIILPGPPKSWPTEGEIKFENVDFRYRPGLPLVLKRVSCTIHPREKIGIVGRTGAGKSSLMLALFRIVEVDFGNIYIDNVNIARVGLKDLRSRLAIIPQDPILFTGTIRSNLDPFSEYSEDKLWDSLSAVSLKDFVSKQDLKLDSVVTENGENLSVGSRQLICLARALLKKTKIIVMDEATASIDFETDMLIQKTIRTEFKHATVLTIAHRINTILDSNRVLVLDQGKIVEFDAPQKLIQNQSSIFASLVKESEEQTKMALRDSKK